MCAIISRNLATSRLKSSNVILALERFPPDLRLILIEYAPVPQWDQYVTGRYDETKKRDSRLLGGGKPVLAPGTSRTAGRWKIDEDDTSPGDVDTTINGHETRGEFRRRGLTRDSSADFGPAPMIEEEEEEDSNPAAPHVRLHLAGEIGVRELTYRIVVYSSPVI